MKTIYKYLLISTPETKSIMINMKKDAKILSTHTQIISNGDERMFVWAEVDTDNYDVRHYFEMYGTGHEFTSDIMNDRKFIGTVVCKYSELVFHIYDIGE